MTSRTLPSRGSSRSRERQPRSSKYKRSNELGIRRNTESTEGTNFQRNRGGSIDPTDPNTLNAINIFRNRGNSLDPTDSSTQNIFQRNRGNSLDPTDPNTLNTANIFHRNRGNSVDYDGVSSSLSPRVRHTNSFQSTPTRQASVSPSPRLPQHQPSLSQSGSSHSSSSPRLLSLSGSQSRSPRPRTSPSPNPQRSNSGDIHSREYAKREPIPNVLGYVANAHDSLNFDIDIEFPADTEALYSSVITHQYAYTSLGKDITYPSLESTHTKTAYRCRLFGIGINYESSERYSQSNSKLMIDIKQLIDACEGWVILCLRDIDVYGRLLVDMCIPLSPENDKCVDLKTYILEIDQKLSDPVYHVYGEGNSGW